MRIVPIFSPALKQKLFKGQTRWRRGLDLMGGLKVILAPDYRVESRVLSAIQTYLLKEIKEFGVERNQPYLFWGRRMIIIVLKDYSFNLPLR